MVAGARDPPRRRRIKTLMTFSFTTSLGSGAGRVAVAEIQTQLDAAGHGPRSVTVRDVVGITTGDTEAEAEPGVYPRRVADHRVKGKRSTNTYWSRRIAGGTACP